MRSQFLLSGFSGDTPDLKIGHVSQWWPIAYIRTLHPEKLATDEELFKHWKITMPHPDYLVSAALSGVRAADTLAIAGLRHQALLENDDSTRDAARQALITLLNLPCGPDATRSSLHQWMVQNGLLENGAPVSMLIGGKTTQVKPLQICIRDEQMAEETVLSEADQRIYGETIQLIHSGKNRKARQLTEDLFLRYPDYPRILTNLATMREAEGEPIENWAPLIRRAAEIEPDYFFARAGLIKLLAKEGRLEEARTELKPLLELEEMHSSEWRALIMAQIAIAKAEADFPALTQLSATLRDCQERFG